MPHGYFDFTSGFIRLTVTFIDFTYTLLISRIDDDIDTLVKISFLLLLDNIGCFSCIIKGHKASPAFSYRRFAD